MSRNETGFDLDDEEYENLSEDERCEIDRNTNELMEEIMFPDGRDDD